MARFKVVADAAGNSATLLGTIHSGVDAALYGRDIAVFVRGYSAKGDGDYDTFNIFVSMNLPHGPDVQQVYIGKVVSTTDGYPTFIPAGD